MWIHIYVSKIFGNDNCGKIFSTARKNSSNKEGFENLKLTIGVIFY